jgi:hypothetical protein
MDKELFIKNLPAFYEKFNVSQDMIEFDFFLNNILSNPYLINELDKSMILYLCVTVSVPYL